MSISEIRKVSKERILARLKECLPDAIRKSGLTQTEIARRIGVSQASVARYAKGELLPSAQILANLCMLLNISPNYIMGLEEHFAKPKD